MLKRHRCPICGKNISTNNLESHFNLIHPESEDIFNISPSISTSPKDRVVVIDAPNILHLSERVRGKLPIKILFRVITILEKKNYNPIAVCSAKTKYLIDNHEKYYQLLKEGKIQESLAGEDDDLFILETARRLKAKFIISNDRFLEYIEDFPKVISRRMQCRIDSQGRIHIVKV